MKASLPSSKKENRPKKSAATFCALMPLLFLLACPLANDSQENAAPSITSSEDPIDNIDVVTPQPACSPKSISESIDRTTRCAVCEGEESVTICGSLVEASCVEQENSIGDPCRICLSDAGDALFDSCNIETSAAFLGELNCREVRREEGETISSCELCTDADGRVVSQFCRPEADLCQEEIIDGLRCNVCTQNGDFSYQECFPEQVEPASCVAYSDEQGRCLDCFNEENILILHNCEVQIASSSPNSCLDWVRPDGVRCSECYDADGKVTEQQCEGSTTEPEQCSLIVLSEFSCGVCINISGDITFTDCQPNVCLEALNDVTQSPDASVDAGTTAESPNRTDDICQQEVPCSIYYDTEGTVCAECTDARGDVEASCSETSTALFCSTVEQNAVSVSVEGSSQCSTDADCARGFICSADICTTTVVTQEECIVCQDRSATEVYRNCETGSTPAAPQCFFEEGQLGLCEICLEPNTGNLIYNSCTDQECVFTEQRQLIDSNGDVFLPATTSSENQLANATCEACQMGTEKCTLNAFCNVNTLDSATLSLCEAPRVRLSYALTNCANPWGETREPLAAAAVLGWALGQNQLIFSAEVSGLQNELSCQECFCETGLTLDIIIAQESLDFFLTAGFTSPINDAVVP